MVCLNTFHLYSVSKTQLVCTSDDFCGRHLLPAKRTPQISTFCLTSSERSLLFCPKFNTRSKNFCRKSYRNCCGWTHLVETNGLALRVSSFNFHSQAVTPQIKWSTIDKIRVKGNLWCCPRTSCLMTLLLDFVRLRDQNVRRLLILDTSHKSRLFASLHLYFGHNSFFFKIRFAFLVVVFGRRKSSRKKQNFSRRRNACEAVVLDCHPSVNLKHSCSFLWTLVYSQKCARDLSEWTIFDCRIGCPSKFWFLGNVQRRLYRPLIWMRNWTGNWQKYFWFSIF